jgi:tRNA nucleotidyltransferase (CCA-adding enzyme)
VVSADKVDPVDRAVPVAAGVLAAKAVRMVADSHVLLWKNKTDLFHGLKRLAKLRPIR